LGLSVTVSNGYALLTVNGTGQGQSYQVWSSTNVDLPFTNWTLQISNLVGAAGDTTQTNIEMGSRSDLFLRVTESRQYGTNTVFQGINWASLASTVTPPDTMGAVGPNHFVELLNGKSVSTSGIRVTDKTGGFVAATNTVSFFSGPGTNCPTGSEMVDVRILYDSGSQRWVASGLDDLGSKQVILAVSNSDSPTNLDSGWTRYLIPVSQGGVGSDFDTLGVDANGIYLSVLHLSTTNEGHTVVAIKKPDIYLGTNTMVFLTNNNDLNLWTLQPAVSFDSVPTNGYAWFVAKGPPDSGSQYQGGPIVYRRLQWNGTNAAWADTNWLAVSTGTNYQDYYDLYGTNLTTFPNAGITAPQPSNGFVVVWNVGSQLASAVIRNGSLWSCHAVGLETNGAYAGDSSGSNVASSGIQWFRLDVSPDGSSLALGEYGRVFDSSQTDSPWWYYYPSLMVNCAGDVVVGFSASTKTNYIGAFYTWRVAGGAAFQPPVFLQAGTAEFTGQGRRWGDYSATTLDPTDDWSFWKVQEYAGGLWGTNQWATVIARIKPN